MDEFADALTLADHVICAEIYAARETDNLGISGEVLMKRSERKELTVIISRLLRR